MRERKPISFLSFPSLSLGIIGYIQKYFMLGSDVSLISKYKSTSVISGVSRLIGYSSLFVRMTGEEGALVNYHRIEISSS